MNGAALIKKSRLLLVNALIFSILGMSFAYLVADTELWPFCSYQMYSRVKADDLIDRLRFFGITADAAPTEISLHESKYIFPFDHARQNRALGHMGKNTAHESLYQEALRDTYERYEARRKKGRHHGPALKGIRLYHLQWKLDPQARNKDLPDQRELVAEWIAPAEKALS